ncbi:hypothetical protein OS175_04405 [Marinicella sp. S1101]|uniref:hypothetical protein n=1 Tax=Marinicella marina TaxID=2996016 RepID=UPI00226096CD|nr:hypothetical protein [Marinicella marina]MCX7553109.1 hypothetical protein [Marinicella marina]MDJ1138841.1 hypothetical protein [Marinicella marina]
MSSFSPNDISKDHVLSLARGILDDCHWRLEINSEIINIDPRAHMWVATRAAIREDCAGYTWGDHYQAKVVIGAPEPSSIPDATIGLYISIDKKVITFDHGVTL